MPAPVRAMIAAPGLTALRPRAVVSRNPLPGGAHGNRSLRAGRTGRGTKRVSCASLAALAADWEEDRRLAAANPPKPFGPSPLGWENGSIGGFLDAAATWGEDSRDGLPGYSRPENAWRRAAQLMLAGKFYE